MAKRSAPACTIRKDRFAPTDGPEPTRGERVGRGKRDTLRELKRGEGKIISIDGKNIAAFRDEAGTLSVRAAMSADLQSVMEP
jgi:hypothetical protein